MRVIALYDVHGNLAALEAVLADPAAAAADAVLIGGDAVPGPEAVAVLDRLEALDVPVHRVRGNGEREVAERVGAPPPDPDDEVAHWAALSAAALGDARSRALADWPPTVTLDGVLYCHATPRSDEEILTRASPDGAYADALADAGAAVVVAGHTHQQHDRTVGAVRLVNAGSVGLPYEGDGAARWALVVDGDPELRRTPYDARATGERLIAAGGFDEASLRAALVDPEDPDAITRLFEARAGR